MALFRKKSNESDASAKVDPDPRHVPQAVPKNMEVSIMEMPYYQYTRDELESVHGKIVQMVKDEKDLAEKVADIWMVEAPKGKTVWIVFKSDIPDSQERTIFDGFNRVSLKPHMGFGSQLLKFAVKKPGIKVLKRAEI